MDAKLANWERKHCPRGETRRKVQTANTKQKLQTLILKIQNWFCAGRGFLFLSHRILLESNFMKGQLPSFCLIASVGLFGGCKPNSSAVPTKLANWERKHFEPGGGKAMIWYVVYGSLTNEISISGSKYRTAGIPAGVELRRFTRAKDG